MSGKVTGWVLENGPRPEHVGRDDAKYGTAKARRLRAVLITIADAANADGCHAHPGQKNMIEGSLYGRSSVLATVADLVADGWIGVEESGGGRGKATVYRVHMTRETVQTVDGSDEANRAIQDGKPSNSEEETARSKRPDQDFRARQRTTNVKTNDSSQSEGESEVSELTNGQRARVILKAYIDDCDAKKKPRPANPGMSAKNIRTLLDAGHSERDVKWALLKAPTHTLPALEMAIRQSGRDAGKQDEPVGQNPHFVSYAEEEGAW